MKNIFYFTLFVFAFLYCANSFAEEKFSYSDWAKILKQYVVQKGPESVVDYKGLRLNKAALHSFTKKLSTVEEATYASWSEPERLAFLINAYNAFTLQLIVEENPQRSIKDIGGLFSNPWKMKFFQLLGEKRNLDWIEHEKIRKSFQEPRIHFAVNCASKGCPALRAEPFVSDRLDAQLEDATKLFLHNPKRNFFDAKNKTFFVSKIFDWYGDDFRKAGRTLEDFLLQHMPLSEAERGAIKAGDVKITFLDYDWTLNEKSGE